MLVEAGESRLGWFAAAARKTRDRLLSLKRPREFPVTFLWFSNGGRDYKPWSGRHTGVLGIEEGRANSVHGHRASIDPNRHVGARHPDRAGARARPAQSRCAT